MFFKKTVLKRMLKSAYTGAGLTVGHTPETDEEEEGYYLSSGWWVLWFKAGMLPKEAKAAVLSYAENFRQLGKYSKQKRTSGTSTKLNRKRSSIFRKPSNVAR